MAPRLQANVRAAGAGAGSVLNTRTANNVRPGRGPLRVRLYSTTIVTGGGGGVSTSVADYGSEPTGAAGDLALPDGGGALRRFNTAWTDAYFGPLWRMYPPNIADFTTIDPLGGTSFASDGDGAFILAPATAGESCRIAYRTAALPATWEWIGYCRGVVPGNTGTFGLLARAASGRFTAVACHGDNTVKCMRFTSPTAFATAPASHGPQITGPEWFRITFDGTNLRFFYSVHPRAGWVLLHTELPATHLLAAATSVGFYTNPKSGTGASALWVPYARLV